jgi:hypothetical protein
MPGAMALWAELALTFLGLIIPLDKQFSYAWFRGEV